MPRLTDREFRDSGNKDTISLDQPIGDEDDNNKTLGDVIEDDQAPTPLDELESVLLRDALQHVLATLSEREAGVIRLRFGLIDGKAHTLDEIDRIYGVTRERIRQLENHVMSKLRNPVCSEHLRDFL